MTIIASWHPTYAFFHHPYAWGEFQNDLDRFSRLIRGGIRPGPTRLEIRPRVEDVASVVQRGKVAMDIEAGPEQSNMPWTAKYPLQARVRTIGLGNAQWGLSWRYGTNPAVKTAIGNLLADRKVLKIVQNGIWYDLPVLARYSMPVRNYRDTRDARRAVSATSRLSLGFMASIYDDTNPWKEDDEDDEKGLVLTDDWDKLMKYNAQDCVETYRVDDGITAEPEWNTLRVQQLYELHYRLSHIAARMHRTGFMVDKKNRQLLADSLDKLYDEREKKVIQAVNVKGFRCTPNDLRKIIYKRHETKAIKRFSLQDPLDPAQWASDDGLGGGTISVDQGSLLLLYVDPGCPDALREIINLYWQAEAAWKARSASVTSRKIDKAIGYDGRIRPGWNSCGTDTGRFSCRDPNVMTLSEKKEEGEGLGGDLPNLRAMYRAAPGKVLIHADFSQLELRVMAAVSKDEVLAKALTTGDVYTEDAKDIFGLPAHFTKKDVKPASRKQAKVVHLGFQYGAGTGALYIQSLESDRTLKFSQVSLIHAAMKKRYHRTVSYWTEEQERVRNTGYSESRILHRRRTYPREPPITEIANYPIQSTASDIANLAMIELDAALRKYKLKGDFVTQLHDAFDVESPGDAKTIDDVQSIMRDCMEKPREIEGVMYKFPVDIKVGTHWSDV
jgi:DNA polymerase I-like protein with 3'-5' exonuclease and polymerase domains